MTLSSRAASAAAGVLAGRLLPPPPDAFHPVARFGASMERLEEHLWSDDRSAGTAYAAAGAGLGVLAARGAPTAAVVGICAAGAQLRDTATAIEHHLLSGDLTGARAALPSLVGRDPSQLDESGVAAAVIESVAENMVDAVFAPAFWCVMAGGSGTAVHRALNTMDAMVGRRNARYENFGWAAARADDIANFVPARLFAAAVAAARPERASEVLATVRADAPAHPSPNAGVAEAAMAGALGCELGGPLRYGDIDEQRPPLGKGPRPDPIDVGKAIDIAKRTEDILVATLAALAGAGWLLGRTRSLR